MTHREEGELQAYLDGELAGERAREVQAHVGECAACRDVLEELRDREALVTGALAAESPAPDLDAARWEARRRWAERRSRARRQWSLRAAAVIVVISGAVAASVPGSPIRALMAEGWERVTAFVTDEPADPAPTVQEAEEAEPAAGRIATEAGPEGLEVRLDGVTEGVEIHVVRVSGLQGALEVAGEAGGFRSAQGMLSAEVGDGPVRVELPDEATVARVLVDGELLVELRDGHLDTPGRQPEEEGDGTATFRY